MNDAMDCLDLTSRYNIQTHQISSLLDLPDDVLATIASFLNVGSLKQARLVNLKFNRVLSLDDAGWRDHCHRLWNHRLHVNPHVFQFHSAKDAYRLSCEDARLRHVIRLDELVFDPSNPSSTVWSFRFKNVAGSEWTRTDPWHDGREARQFVFLANGQVKQLVAHGNKLGYTLQPAFYDASNLSGGLEISWRFVTQPIDFPKKESGAYLRLTIAGRDVPTYIIHRSPSGNWGFCMENCWGVFASFALPRKVSMQPIPRPPRLRLRRDSNGGARWLDVSLLESDEEDESYDTKISRLHLLEDSALAVSCRWQWREALLYNLGASVLPDGPNATAEFERAWHDSLHSMQNFGFPVLPPAPTQPPQNAPLG